MRTFSNYDDWSSACGKTGLVTRQIAGYQQYEAFDAEGLPRGRFNVLDFPEGVIEDKGETQSIDEDAFAIEPPMPRRKSNVMS
jgi:hypothetical protein